MHADRGRDAKRAGHDRGVRSRTAEIGGKSEDFRFVENGRLGRGEVVGDKNVRRGELGQTDAARAGQIAQDTARHVFDVDRAFAQVVVLHFQQRLGVPFGDHAQHRLDIFLVDLEPADHFLHEGAVVDDQQMRVKNTCAFRAKRRLDLFLNLVDLVAGGNQGLFKPCDFAGDFVLVDVALDDPVFLGGHQEDGTGGDPGRHPDAFQHNFFWFGFFHDKTGASVFVKLIVDQIADRVEHILGVRAGGRHFEFRPAIPLEGE